MTGVGPISAIGAGREDFWDALVAGRHGFGPITLCDDSESPSKVAAEVKDFRMDHYVRRGTGLARHTPRPTQLALGSAILALHDAELDLDACDPNRLGVHVGTGIGTVDTVLRMREKYGAPGVPAPPHIGAPSTPRLRDATPESTPWVSRSGRSRRAPPTPSS